MNWRVKMSRELDRLIHFNVLKKEPTYDVKVNGQLLYTNLDLKEANRQIRDHSKLYSDVAYMTSNINYPYYSSDFESALLVVEALEDKFFVLQHDKEWTASFGTVTEHVTAKSENPAKAICLAALESCGIKL